MSGLNGPGANLQVQPPRTVSEVHAAWCVTSLMPECHCIKTVWITDRINMFNAGTQQIPQTIEPFYAIASGVNVAPAA
jgi:hypothetical protein